MVKILVISDLESRFKEIKSFRKKVDLVLSIGSSLNPNVIPSHCNLNIYSDKIENEKLSSKKLKLAPILFLQDGPMGSFLNFKSSSKNNPIQKLNYYESVFLGKIGLLIFQDIKIVFINGVVKNSPQKTRSDPKK